MIELTKDQLKKLQKIELELLIEVDRICKKYNIKYNIIAGTMLGAVRHGGFIPWDDDADIAMLRPEYERFRKICETELDSDKFYFQDNRNTPGYRWGYGKIRRKNTLFLREYQEHMPYEQGVFIDIFPMDNIPDNYIHRSIHNFHCFCIRKLLWSEVGRKAEKKKWLRNWYSLLSKIPENVIFNHYEKFIKRSNKRETKLVRMLMFPSPTKDYGYKIEWYLDRKKILFEGYEFEGCRDYQGYLTHCYGDYMKIPPKEKQKVHPVSDIKLIDVNIK